MISLYILTFMWDGGIDRRKFPRARCKCLIYIKTKNRPKPISTYTENIGQGGICVVVNEDLGLFRNVDFELTLENGIQNNIQCSGTVVWVVKKHPPKKEGDPLFDTGIEFVGMAGESKKRIAKIVEDALRKETQGS